MVKELKRIVRGLGFRIKTKKALSRALAEQAIAKQKREYAKKHPPFTKKLIAAARKTPMYVKKGAIEAVEVEKKLYPYQKAGAKAIARGLGFAVGGLKKALEVSYGPGGLEKRARETETGFEETRKREPTEDFMDKYEREFWERTELRRKPKKRKGERRVAERKSYYDDYLQKHEQEFARRSEI